MEKRGFTLVELVAVVIILGILMAVGIPQYLRAMERSRGAEAFSTLAAVQEGEKIFNTEYETYTCRWMTANNLPGLGVRPAGPTAPPGCANNVGVSNAPGIRWAFEINAAQNTFLATATRVGGGRCVGQTITVNETGTVAGNWEACVNTL